MMDNHANFAYSTVAGGTAVGTTGAGTLIAQPGDGTNFPASPYNIVVWPPGVQPLASNAEIMRVTAKSGDTLTVSRAQEGTTAKAFGLGYQVAAAITVKDLTDVEDVANSALTLASQTSDGNPPSSSPTAVVKSAVGALDVSWSPITNTDPVFYDIYISTTTGFTPGPTTLVATVQGSIAFIAHDPSGADLVPGTTYYVKIIARDTDGSAAAGTQGSGTPLADPSATDGFPPSSSPTPTLVGGPGFITATWTAIVNPDPVTYDVYASTTNGFTPGPSTLIGSTAATQLVISNLHGGTPLVTGTTYYVRVAARDPDGSATAGTQVSSTTGQVVSSDVHSDGILPSTPAQPVVNPGIGFIVATWTPVTNQSDPVQYRVYVDTSSGFTPGTGNLYGTTSGNSIVINKTGGPTPVALTYGQTYFVKIIAFDVDGASGASTGGSAAPAQVIAGDITNGTITGTQIANNAIDTPQLNANAVTAAKIAANTITAAQIAANTITAAQIAANTITAGQIAANTITAGQIAAGTITATQIAAGTITATQIAANTITAAKIAANTITAAQIAAGTITATQIQSGTITGTLIAGNTITATNMVTGTITAASGIINDIDASVITSGIVSATVLEGTALTAIQADITDLATINANMGLLTAGAINIDGPSGGSMSFDENGLVIFDAANPPNAVVSLPTDQSLGNYFQGKINANQGLSGVGVTLGGDGVINPGTTIVVAGGVAPALSGPQVSMTWPDTTIIPIDQEQTNFAHWGLFHDHASGNTYVGCQSHNAVEAYSAGGNKVLNFGIDGSSGHHPLIYGVALLGGSIWVLTRNASGSTFVSIQKYNSSGVFQNETQLTGMSNANFAGLGTDGTDLYVGEVNGSNTLVLHRFTLTGGNLTSGTPANNYNTAAGTYTGDVTGVTYDGTNFWVAFSTGAVAKAFSLSGTTLTYQSNRDFQGSNTSQLYGLSYDATAGYFWSQPLTQRFNRHTNWDWTTESTKYWLSFSYRNKNLLPIANQSDYETSALAADGITSQTGFGSATLSQQFDTVHGGNDALVNAANDGFVSIASLKVVASATLNSGVLLGDTTNSTTSKKTLVPVIPGQAYCTSVWMRGDVGGEAVCIDFRWYDASGIRISESSGTFPTLTTTWTRYFIDNQVAPAGAVFAGVRVFTVAASVMTWYMDDAQVEEGSTTTTLEYPAETIISPRSSITMRRRAALTFATPDIPEGAEAMRFYMNRGTTDPGGTSGSILQTASPDTSFEFDLTTGFIDTFLTTGANSPASGMAFGAVESAEIVAGATDGSGEPFWRIDGAGRIRFLGPTMQNQFWMYSDFFEAVGAAQVGPLLPVTSGTGAGFGTAAAVDHPGVWQLQTGTTGAGVALVRSNTSGIQLGLAHMRFSALVMVPTLSTSTQKFLVFAGLLDTSGSPYGSFTGENGVGFRYNDTGTADPGNWELSLANGASHSLTSGVKVNAGQWYFLEFDVAPDGVVTWFIDGLQVGQTADGTNTPTSGLGVSIGIQKSAGTTSRNFNVDCFSLYGDFVSP